MNIALDATYSIGKHLSGVGVYSRRILEGVALAHPDCRFTYLFRPHRFWRGLRERAAANVRRRPLDWAPTCRAALFHGLNQRMPSWRARRSVCTFHDLFVMTGEYSTAEFRARFERQAREAAARADLIITVSAFTAGQVSALLNVENSRLRAIHHGVDAPDRVAGDLERENLVLSVGAIQKRKNVARLVEAFESLPEDWRLVLAGGAGFDSGAILERIERSPAAARIQVTGYVDETTLHGLYSRARIFAFPSLDEGFGIPALEAMAWGVPVIASNRSALPEVVGEAAMQVDPEDVDQLAEGLRGLARDSSQRRELSDRGRQRALQFPWEKAVRNTWDVYRELLA